MAARTDKSPRQRLDVDARRQAILDAAAERYAAAGFSQVTVAEVAERAGASAALVFHYFGNKAGLYAAVIEAQLAALDDALESADAALWANASNRDRVRTALLVRLDDVAAHRTAWAVGTTGESEPAEALAVRRGVRETDVAKLRGLLHPSGGVRHDYALWGFYGFCDQAFSRWAANGCPERERHALVDAALGALEGALGDWAG